MSITLRQLEAFVAVAAEAHFGKAAARIHVTQPVISQEIKRLERLVGTSLFDRSTRSVALTSVGTELLPHAEDALCAMRTFTERARRLAREPHGEVRVAASPSIVDRLLPALLRRAEAELPQVSVVDVPVQTGEVVDALTGGDADLGIGRFLHAPEGYRTRTIGEEDVYALLSEAHPLAGRDALDLAELGDLPLLLWPRERHAVYFDHLVGICTDRGLTPLLLAGPPQLVGARSYLIADGRAFALIPESTALRPIPGTRAIPLARAAQVPLELVVHGSHPRPEIRRVADLALTV